MKTLIIQSSFPRSASTLLVNVLYGLIVGLQDMPVIWNDFRHPYRIEAPITIFKTHDTNLADLDFLFKEKYNTFFICSERGATFDHRLRQMPNAAILDYTDLNNVPVPEVCERLSLVIADMIPYINLSIPNCVARVEAMNRRYAEIASKPFNFVDSFYQLHGSHRLRGAAPHRHPNRSSQ